MLSTDTSSAHYCYIRVLHLRNRMVTARETSSNIPGLRRIPAQTVRNRLHENGYAHTRRSYFAAVLRRRHRLARVQWCNSVRGWDLQNWRQVWFSDKSRFMLQTRDGCIRVFKRRNEMFAGRQFWRRKCEDMGCHILRPKNSTGAHPRQP